MTRCLVTLLCALCFGATYAQEEPQFGHSHLGSAFDSGMRQKPWKFENIGNAPFPITTENKEMQEWYDQGNELLHSFWFEEAERSFRWCLKLEPDSAMAYFGLARCGMNWFSITAGSDPSLFRFREFLAEAVKRKDTVSDRERLYIEAWDAAWSKNGFAAQKEIVERLKDLCLRYPDDIEGKTQLAFMSIGQVPASENEVLIEEILAVNPMHPGAHHARIHTWDGRDSEQAIDSCELYGQAAPGVGHALHMPGHIYSKIGMWHEAAIAMDSATRVELRHMNERLALPFENWNYPHNRDYLSYIQEQLGRPGESIQGLLDILNSPTDPESRQEQYPAATSLIRALVKFERWEQILNPDFMPRRPENDTSLYYAGARILALVGLARVAEARTLFEEKTAASVAKMEEAIAQNPEREEQLRRINQIGRPVLLRVAEAKLLLAEGKQSEGLEILKQVAEREATARANHQIANDPPSDPWPTMRLVGDAFFASGDFTAAIGAYEKALAQEPNDAWCLGGLAKAHAAGGNTEQAKIYAARLLAVWNGADASLPLLKEVQALRLNAAPRAETVRPERVYVPEELDVIGPSNWEPFAAPVLDCADMDGKRVRLTDFRGQNVLLVFYLSDQCVHCMEQLGAINTRLSEFGDENTVVLGVSATSPESNRESVTLAPYNVTLLSDHDHENARRFASYDDFEEMELHSTILIDTEGRVRWKRTGGDPFGDVDFLLKEIRRWVR